MHCWMLRVVSMALWPILNSNKISWNCFFSNITSLTLKYFPGGSDGKSICLQSEIPRFDPWVGKILWRRIWQPTPVFLAGKSHGWRSLAGYSPWGRKESDMTERLHFFFFLSSVKWDDNHNLYPRDALRKTSECLLSHLEVSTSRKVYD